MRGLRALLALALAAAPLAAAPAAAEAPRRLAPETVADLARGWALAHFGPELAGATLQPLGSPRALVLPPGPVETTVSLQAGAPAAGHLVLLVEAAVPGPAGRVERSATVTFRVDAPREALVAVRELPRGVVLGPADVRVERRPAERLPRQALADPAAALGKEIVRPVAPGEVLTAAVVAPLRAVRRGAVVTLVLDGPGFRIQARGVAAEDGAVGQVIRVVNQTSRRELAGRVEDERTVRVGF
jgi:flagella basal body P-ring formation protein FlgA